MPRLNRREIVPENQIGVFHCIQRCVRRAFLCGFDHATQKNFDHRKLWVQNRLRQLASLFGIDVCGYAVMSNHLHVILRTRPDVVAAWSNEEVAKRWWTLFTGYRDLDHETGPPTYQPTDKDLAPLLNNPGRLAELRQRLGSLSWFMRCLAEPIGRRANGEDERPGRFFEGRFKLQVLLDE